jgi:GT2 family glycosyltransferase
MPQLLSIVVTYNGEKWIDKCFGSLSNSNFKTEIYCIDNCSTDRTVEFLNSKYVNVKIKKLSKNFGFGHANNLGLKYAVDNNFDYVFLLNQDASVEPNTIGTLIEVASSDQGLGILSPIHLDGSGVNIDLKFSNYISETNCNSFISDSVLNKTLREFYTLPFVNAAAWLLPIKTIEVIGGFDPLFFHYGEDDNYCQRVIFHKLMICIVPTANILHDRSQLLEYFSPYSSIKNFDRFIKIKIPDINNSDFEKVYISEIGKIKTSLYASIFTLDFRTFKKFYNIMKHLISLKSQLKSSYNQNRIKKLNYLE